MKSLPTGKSGREDLPIRVFRLEDITLYYSEEQLGASCTRMQVPASELVERTPGIIAFYSSKLLCGRIFGASAERQHHFCEGGFCRRGMVSYGYSRP